MNDHASQTDLDLLALDYTQGLMDASATEAFEQTLAESQLARQAVERAVLLQEAAQSVAPATQAPVVGRIHPWVAAVAAALVAAAGVSLIMQPSDPPPSHAAKPGADRAPTPATDAESRLALVNTWMALETDEEDPMETETLASAPVDESETLNWLNAALQSREN